MMALGFALFILIGLMAFWMLFFVLTVAVPLWFTFGAMEMLRPKRLLEEEDNN